MVHSQASYRKPGPAAAARIGASLADAERVPDDTEETPRQAYERVEPTIRAPKNY